MDLGSILWVPIWSDRVWFRLTVFSKLRLRVWDTFVNWQVLNRCSDFRHIRPGAYLIE
jgi:hypothetical protein